MYTEHVAIVMMSLGEAVAHPHHTLTQQKLHKNIYFMHTAMIMVG